MIESSLKPGDLVEVFLLYYDASMCDILWSSRVRGDAALGTIVVNYGSYMYRGDDVVMVMARSTIGYTWAPWARKV